jgi:trehalose 6-phosphate phosphatase
MALPFMDCSARRLDEIVKHRPLCVFDFDGTLAPIVTQPDEARVPLGILLRLTALSRHAPIAVIAGRSVTDLQARLGFEPEFIVGNHGLEGLPQSERFADRYKQLCRDWEEKLAAELQTQAAFDPAIRIENKGYSLSVHYRLARDQAATRQQMVELFSRLAPAARVVAGKCVFNLLPEGAGDKSTALEQLMRTSGATSAIYVGDDTTDEDVFRLRRADLLTIRVGLERHSAAEFFLPHQLDMFHALDGLIGRMRQARIQNWMDAAPAHHAYGEGIWVGKTSPMM